MTTAKPLRILHVVGGMNRGGVETWLMHILRNIDRQKFQMDFMVETAEPCAYDDEIRSLGSAIIPCLEPKKPRRYTANFRAVYREHGPFDVVHSHVHHYSGFVLRLAHAAGVPVRLAHSHSDRRQLEARAGVPRRLYLHLAKRLLRRHATAGFAVSGAAAASLYGEAWATNPRWRVLYCGVDLEPFRARVDAAALRVSLGIPADAFTLGHVGRFIEVKNQLFLLDIFAEVLNADPSARLLLVGEGPLLLAVRERAAALGLADKVVFGGVRGDVPELMVGAMDVFVMPSLYEGLPLVGIEAQAAGLPLVVSDTVTTELGVVEGAVTRLSLAQPAKAWADVLRPARTPLARAEALATVERSPFNVVAGLRGLEQAYTQHTQYTQGRAHATR